MLSPVLANAGRMAMQAKQSVAGINTSMAQSMKSAASSARSAFNQIGNITDKVTGKNRLLKRSYSEVQDAIRRLETGIQSSRVPSTLRAYRKEIEALRREANSIGSMGGFGGKSGGSGIMGMLGGMGGIKSLLLAGGLAIGVNQLVSSASSFIQDSVSKSLERQKIQTSFNVLAGNKQAGEALTRDLVKYQNDTILGSEVFKSAQTLMAFGVEAKDVMADMKMLGDVSLGDAQRFGSLTLAFAQTQSAGKLMGQDLLQYVNAGFNPLQVISEKTGISMGKLRDMMKDGDITARMVADAFKVATSEGGKYYKMLDTIAETPAGKLEQLKGEWDNFKVEFGAALMPLFEILLNYAEKMLPLLQQGVEWLVPKIQAVAEWINEASDSTAGWKDYIVMMGQYAKEHFIPYVQKLWGLITDIVGKLMEFIRNSPMLKELFQSLLFISGTILDFVTGILDKFQWIFDNILMPMLRLGDMMLTLQSAPWRIAFGKSTIGDEAGGLWDKLSSGWIFGNAPEQNYSTENHATKGMSNLSGIVNTSPYLQNGNYKSLIDIAGNYAATAKKEQETAKLKGLTPDSFMELLNPPGNGKKGKKGKKKGARDRARDMAASGARETNIHINLNKEMISQVTINPVTMSQGAGEIERMLMECLSRVLNSANRVAFN